MAVTSAPSSLPRWRIVGLRRPVVDLSRSIDFYVRGLGFELQSLAIDRASLRLGHESIDLVQADLLPPPADGPDIRFQHAAIVVSDMQQAFDRLMLLAPVTISRDGPQKLPAPAGGVVAFKFRDPDGHPLELIKFPAGGGDARWHAPNATTSTLGIDHFALSVHCAPLSIAFYERRFGFDVASRQVNHGEEQARLDGLPISTVSVIAFAPGAPGAPHIELLCYADPPPRVGPAAQGAVDCLVISSARDGIELLSRGRTGSDPDGHVFECGASR